MTVETVFGLVENNVHLHWSDSLLRLTEFPPPEDSDPHCPQFEFEYFSRTHTHHLFYPPSITPSHFSFKPCIQNHPFSPFVLYTHSFHQIINTSIHPHTIQPPIHPLTHT